MSVPTIRLEAVLAELARLVPNPNRSHPMVLAVLEYVRSHISEPLTVEDLANVANLSRSRFAQKYRMLTGQRRWVMCRGCASRRRAG